MPGSSWRKHLHIAVAIAALILSIGVRCRADEHAPESTSTIDFSGYVDGILTYDRNDLPSRNRPYTTQPYYADEPALNLGYIDARLRSREYRGRLALQYGSSVIANYADEPELFFRYIQEGFVGARIADRLTLDVGIFFSHIGTETWISKDNINVGRSLIADYSPYYQSGARLTFVASDHVTTELHIIRGWQNISGDDKPALGTKISYSSSERLTFQHSSFFGEIEGLRVFNDIGFTFQASSSLTVLGAYDLGLQERRDNTTAVWHGWAVSSRYQTSDTIALGFRVERYADPSEVLIQSLSTRSFTALGLSCNIDYAVTERLTWRNEYRVLMSTAEVFPDENTFVNSDSIISSSIQYTLDLREP
jgi:hypothetical protein